MNVLIFMSFLVYSIILVVTISFVYNFNWDTVFSKYQVNLLTDNSYRFMDDLRNENFDTNKLNDEDINWIKRRANLYGILIQIVDPLEKQVLVDTLSNYDSSEISVIQNQPFYVDGELETYIRFSTLNAYFELNPVVMEYMNQMRLNSQILLFSLLVTSILVSWFVAKFLSKHINRLGYHADEIRKGERNVNIQVKGPEEIRRLAVTLNDMSSELKKQEDWRQHLMEDIAHELRNPFTSMLSQLEAIIDGVYEANEHRLHEIYEELDRLSRLVNDLEDLSEAESANFTLNIKRTNMVRITKRVYQNFVTMAKSKGIKLLYEPTNVPCYGQVDRDKIIQVISNLLSNAIKYSPNGGLVTLSVDWNDSHTIIICEDHGIGIAEEDIPYIFNRLYRVDKSRSRFSGGVGLGLSIVKALVEAHDGEVSVKSEVGKGSIFTVELPNVHKSWDNHTSNIP